MRGTIAAMTGTPVDAAALVDGVLGRALAQGGGRQIFLFGATGDPFWAARNPVQAEELDRLSEALGLIERLEQTRAKPFFAYTPRRDLLVVALDAREDLYIVMLDAGPDTEAAEARVAVIRQELAPHVGSLRKELYRRARG
jgi:hypothetical protein